LGEAISDVRVRELGPVNLKSGLDKTAEKNAKILRMRSASRNKNHSKDDYRAPWDVHHTHSVQDSMHALRQEN